MAYILRSNARTIHIEGIAVLTKVTGDGEDDGSGVVAYYAQSACPSLTKSGYKMTPGQSFDEVGPALAAARVNASINGKKVCGHCEKAARRVIAEDEAALVPVVTHFVCTTCGTTDEDAKCIGGEYGHRGGRKLLPADFKRYMESRRPVDREECAKIRADLKSGRESLAARVAEAGAKAAAANTHLSPTAQATVAASAARDEAMRLAYEAEGTDGEAAADAAFRSADAMHHNAIRNHRAACEAWESSSEVLAEHEAELATSEPARALYLTACIAMAAGRHLTACDGSEAQPHVVTPAYTIAERLHTVDMRFCVFVEGMAVIYAPTLPEAVAKVPEALADVAASCEPGDYAPTGCVTADIHECWSRELIQDPAEAPEPETVPATVRIRRHNRTTVHAAIATTGTDAGREEGTEFVTLCGTPGPLGNKLRGWLILGDDALVTCERCGADPTEPTPTAVEEAPTYASCPVKWATGEPCEGCRARAAAIAANAALTPDKAASNARMGAALTTVNTEPEEPRMARFQIVINQVVTTTIYVEASDREAAVDLAVNELPELCAQCAGMGPRESAQVSEVNAYINDSYDEPQVTELDEHGCIPATPADLEAAAVSFARVITEQSHQRDGLASVTYGPGTTHATADLADLVGDLPPALAVIDIDAPRALGPSVLINPDPVNLSDLPDAVMAGRHLEAATRERLIVAVEEPEALDHMTGAERACDVLARKYLYSAERYARTGDGEDGERADNILELFHLAAFTADRCAAIGVDWTCGEATLNGEATCAAHRGALPAKGTRRG